MTLKDKREGGENKMSLILVRCKNCGHTLLTTDYDLDDKEVLNNLLSPGKTASCCGNERPALEKINRAEILSYPELIKSVSSLPPYFHSEDVAKEGGEEMARAFKEIIQQGKTDIQGGE